MNALVKIFYLVRFSPIIIIFYTHRKRELLVRERRTWLKIIKKTDTDSLENFLWLLTKLPEYRSAIYYRVGGFKAKLLRLFANGQTSLHLNISASKVGEGLVIQHGYSTIVDAKSIGRNCQIWHNVTIGTNKSGTGNKALIGDNVKICAGAFVLGNIVIGDNVTIGAGAVVVKDVPPNSVVAGNPACILFQDGKKVKIAL